MTTGFNSRVLWKKIPVSGRLPGALIDCILGLVLAGMASSAVAVQVGLAGIVGGKAVLVVDGSRTRTLGVGQSTAEGIRLVALDTAMATIEIEGSRRTLRLGQNVSGAGAGSRQTAVVVGDQRGQYVTMGSVNGYPVRFLVDTGATLVSIGASEGRRLGIESAGGERSLVQTANGIATVRRVRLDSVRVGDISIDGVDALVLDGDMPIALLGMSFLNRTDIDNEGGRMTLKKRY